MHIFSFLILTVIVGLTVASCIQTERDTAQSNLQRETSLNVESTQRIPTTRDTAQSNLQRETSLNVDATALSDLAAGNTGFAFDFYQAVRDEDGNLFYSPYSISLALAMTYAGARGETELQMSNTLNFTLSQEHLHPTFNALDLELASRSVGAEGDDELGFRINIANSIWGQQGYAFLPEFLDLLAENYGAGLRLTDFVNQPETSRLAIDDWVSDRTEDRVKDLIPEGAITDLTRLVLANAIYFNASWLHRFHEFNTQDGPFTTLDGEQVIVPMMSMGKPVDLLYTQGPRYQAVELPYIGEDLAMLIIVPDAGMFTTFETELNTEQLDAILTGLERKTVDLTLLKFSFDSDFSLSETLTDMDMPDAFVPNVANFSGMDGTRKLYISDIFHKAFVAVDEAGTEAAAATAVEVQVVSEPVVDVELTIDRPFIFLIHDVPTDTILFIGRILNPELSQQ